MEKLNKHPLHIKNSELQTSPEVNRAVERGERKTEERVPNDPSERIDVYMDRLENIFLNPDERVRERNLDMFRDKIYDALIIKKENFPESYFELQQRIARERGQAVEEIPENVREQMMDVAIEDQKHSLDAWIDYLTSEDAVYPAWFKYYAWNQITKLSQFDKERGEFKKRTSTTVAPYPDIYREPLAQIADIYLKVKEDNKHLREPDIKEAFSKKFPTLYAELISKSLAASMEGREEIRGEWVKYEQGDSGAAQKLFESLEGKGTGWCTAGKSTAETQIESGDFYVYYTNDASGEPTQPRLAIRMDGNNKIGEVRGVLPHQGVELLMQEVLDGKLSEFGSEADAYRKKSEDMRILTSLEHKKEKEEPFTKDDLVFLYEINSTIEGFGYQKDPRIGELRKDRNTEEDMLTIFDYIKDQVAHIPNEITEGTKAYIGQLEPGIFEKLPETLEHVYTSFPGNKIKRESVRIGGMSKEQLISVMDAVGIYRSHREKSMMENPDFITGTSREEAKLVRLTVADLGFKTSATTDQIYERAQALGLELCPPDTGPHYRLQYKDQPLYKGSVCIGMKPITSSLGIPCVFDLVHTSYGLELSSDIVKPGTTWDPAYKFVFRFRKAEA
ncbi:MAG: hypothetical protein KBC35_04445 [Candidatus Pacebacteria bacterium]|nr:hypothetical protein [Candidatus Paceibacterota bacterium]